MNWGFVRVVACAYALAGATAISQSPARPSLSLDVKVVSSGGEVRSDRGTEYGGLTNFNPQAYSTQYVSTRHRESQTKLEIGVRNFGRTPQAAVIEALFFGKPLRGAQVFVVNSTSDTRELPPAAAVQLRSSSANVTSLSEKRTSSTTTTDSYGNRQTLSSAQSASNSSKLYGWIVRVLVDGEVIQTRASNPTLDQLAKNQGALDALRGPRPIPSLQRQPGRLQ